MRAGGLVVDADQRVGVHAEAHRRTGGVRPLARGVRMAAGSRIGGPLGAVGRACVPLQFLAAAGAGVGEAPRLQHGQRRLVHGSPLALAVGAGGAAAVGAFVPVEAEPAQVVQHPRLRAGHRARGVDVLHPQDEQALVARAVLAGQQGRAEIAGVQVAGGAGGVASHGAVARHGCQDVVAGHGGGAARGGGVRRPPRAPSARPCPPSHRRAGRRSPPRPRSSGRPTAW